MKRPRAKENKIRSTIKRSSEFQALSVIRFTIWIGWCMTGASQATVKCRFVSIIEILFKRSPPIYSQLLSQNDSLSHYQPEVSVKLFKSVHIINFILKVSVWTIRKVVLIGQSCTENRLVFRVETFKRLSSDVVAIGRLSLYLPSCTCHKFSATFADFLLAF